MWRKIICFFASDSQMRKAFVCGLVWNVLAGGFSDSSTSGLHRTAENVSREESFIGLIRRPSLSVPIPLPVFV
jgi:hypothetical protein